jgi:hypothetical protein
MQSKAMMKASFTTLIQRPNDKAQNGITPHCPKRTRKQYSWPAQLWELPFGTVRDAFFTEACYIQTLNKLHHALCEKHPKKKKTVILQHDNVRPHSAHLNLQTIQKDSRELLSHPLYSLDLVPSDYHCFGPL